MVAKVGHPEDGTERQGPVGTGQRVFVIGHATRCGFALKELAIPGRNAKLIPMMVPDGDFGSGQMVSGGSRPSTRDTHKNSQNRAGESKPAARTFRVIGSSDSVHDPPPEIVGICFS
jgi:hypothetical protein